VLSVPSFNYFLKEYARYYPHCGQSMTVGRCIISNDSQADEHIYKGYTVLDLSVSFASESYKNEVMLTSFAVNCVHTLMQEEFNHIRFNFRRMSSKLKYSF